MVKLSDKVKFIKGVGEAQAKKLAKLGIITIDDLINYYPKRYDDFSQITPIAQLKTGPVTIQGEIKRTATRRSHRGLSITEALIDDSTGAVKAIWFNQPYLAQSVPLNTPVYVSGQLDFKYNNYALQNPALERVSSFPKNTARIVPIYTETAGLSSKQIRKLIEQILPDIKKLPETLPPPILQGISLLLSRADALTQIHFPESIKRLEEAKRRIAFEELFYLILTGLVIKHEMKTESSYKIKFNEKLARDFTDSLPFKFTDAQRKAAWRILQDIDSAKPMNRLLEGDVGSGKTVVAAMAVAMAAHNGYQSALLAPTAVLAQQHFETFQKLGVKDLCDSVRVLTSSVKGAKRESLLRDLQAGEIDLIIGTHALLEDPVRFCRLGLVIIDEQHRFGVKQRQVLKEKAGKLPHLLAMSATPIPRSLALTVYGDLDVSIIDELPPGRRAIETHVVSDYQRDETYRLVDSEIAQGRQAYIICPLVSDSDKLGVKSVESEAKRLKNTIFNHRRIGLLHGQLKADEKQAIMSRFKAGEIDILVSTTVIEVGVDVPNATIMMIEGAERFGLASLHQLRGRVGRGQNQSYCYLFASNDSQSVRRLELLKRYNDGFVLAQKDLELRGPGELYGRRQHGLLDLRMANLSDTKLIAAVQRATKAYLANDPNLLQYPHIRNRVNQLKAVTSLD